MPCCRQVNGRWICDGIGCDAGLEATADSITGWSVDVVCIGDLRMSIEVCYPSCPLVLVVGTRGKCGITDGGGDVRVA